MQIEYNGDLIETAARNLAEFFDEQQIDTASIATAINGDFIPRARYSSEPLAAGAKLEVLSAMQGG